MPPKAPSTRAKRNVIKRSSTQKQRVNGQKRVAETAVSESEDTDDAASDADQEKDYEDDVKSLHSDALDDDSDLETKKLAGKRKRASHVKTPRAKGSSPRKRRKNAVNYEDEEGEDYDLKEGQQVVGRVVQAPTTGRGQCCSYVLRRPGGTDLTPQFPLVRYLKIRSTFFCSSQIQSAMTVNGESLVTTLPVLSATV
jgi:hypothetical protein